MHKLDKYCRRFTDNYVKSTRSRYYRMNGHVLRISDHISMNTNALFAIIIRPEGYILHHPSSGHCDIISYKEALAFVKMFSRFPIYHFSEPNEWKLAKNEQLIVKEEQVGNVPLNVFSKNQQERIREFIAQRIACGKLVL